MNEAMAARAGAVRARGHDHAPLGGARGDGLAVVFCCSLRLSALTSGCTCWSGSCPASIVLRRLFGLRSALYENDDRAPARTKEVSV